MGKNQLEFLKLLLGKRNCGNSYNTNFLEIYRRKATTQHGKIRKFKVDLAPKTPPCIFYFG
ncbi:hypothetical protein LEP1GSC088_3539 [Leptospira interrogans str. L1207]|nr:hypothetical protein LEP1GSC088_3539 [Leptospira interrogans str. L1207]